MSNAQKFSDEQLVAYLDGESDHAPIEEINEALKTDAALHARLDQITFDQDALTASLKSLLEQAPAAPEIPAELIQPQRRSFVPALAYAAAAALLFLFVGFGGGYYLAPREKEPGWRAIVASYQSLYVNSTLSHINQDDAALDAELVRVSQAIGRKFELSETAGVETLDYKRAQLLGFRGKPLVQLAYLSKIGEPVALCIIKSAKTGTTNVTETNLWGMSAAHWRKDGYAYLLIGGTDQQMIRSAAQKFSETL
ncbi:MAG: hypothetical protein AAF468_03035 [Pseudomonadota bacterium]